eukprot:scaffold2696_cov333-Pavlova_lutheri.AAC.26
MPPDPCAWMVDSRHFSFERPFFAHVVSPCREEGGPSCSSQLGEEPQQHEEPEREEHEVQQVVASSSHVRSVESVHGASHGRLGSYDALFERLQHLVVRLGFRPDVFGQSREPGHLRAESFDLLFFVELRSTSDGDLHVFPSLRPPEQRVSRRGGCFVRRGRAFHPRSFPSTPLSSASTCAPADAVPNGPPARPSILNSLQVNPSPPERIRGVSSPPCASIGWCVRFNRDGSSGIHPVG